MEKHEKICLNQQKCEKNRLYIQNPILSDIKEVREEGTQKETTLHNPSQTDLRTLKPISEKNFKITFHCPSAIASSPSSLRVAVPFHPLSFHAALLFFLFLMVPVPFLFRVFQVWGHILYRGALLKEFCRFWCRFGKQRTPHILRFMPNYGNMIIVGLVMRVRKTNDLLVHYVVPKEITHVR